MWQSETLICIHILCLSYKFLQARSIARFVGYLSTTFNFWHFMSRHELKFKASTQISSGKFYVCGLLLQSNLVPNSSVLLDVAPCRQINIYRNSEKSINYYQSTRRHQANTAMFIHTHRSDNLISTTLFQCLPKD
jgi:hypothetical protein